MTNPHLRDKERKSSLHITYVRRLSCVFFEISNVFLSIRKTILTNLVISTCNPTQSSWMDIRSMCCAFETMASKSPKEKNVVSKYILLYVCCSRIRMSIILLDYYIVYNIYLITCTWSTHKQYTKPT